MENSQEQRKSLLLDQNFEGSYPNHDQMYNIEEIENGPFKNMKMKFSKLEFKHMRFVGVGGSAFYKAFAIAMLERAGCLQENSLDFFQQFERKWNMKQNRQHNKMSLIFQAFKTSLSQSNSENAQKSFLKNLYKFGLQNSYFYSVSVSQEQKMDIFLREQIKSFLQARSQQLISGRLLHDHITFEDNYNSLSKFKREIISEQSAFPTSSIFLILASIFTIPLSIIQNESGRIRDSQEYQSKNYSPERFCAEFDHLSKEHPITIVRYRSSYYILYKSKEKIQYMIDSFKYARETLGESSKLTAHSSTGQSIKNIKLNCGHIFTRGQIAGYLRENFPIKPQAQFDKEDRFITYQGRFFLFQGSNPCGLDVWPVMNQ